MPTDDYIKVKRWEGKPWSFKLKFFVANYPEMALITFSLAVVTPLLLYYNYQVFPGSRQQAVEKYRSKFTVVRDDDSKIEFYKAQKELGREHFPKL